ncbi:MAG: hypothetical protein AAF570_08440 [Bacteroidota bacterium]
MKKRSFQIMLYAGLITFSWVIVGLSSASHDRQLVTDLQPVLLNEENNHFLSMDDVRDLVRDIQGRPIEECKLGEVQVANIERSLKENPYVKFAEAYTRIDGDVVVELELRKPLARVMYDDGTGFYLDKDFRKVDLSAEFTANTILLRGLPLETLEPRDSIRNEALATLEPILRHIDGSEFLRSQVSEIQVNKNGELVIYPEVGDCVIEFGKPHRIEEKFDNLELFYHEVLNNIGWEKYHSISLKFRDQVVARKS